MNSVVRGPEASKHYKIENLGRKTTLCRSTFEVKAVKSQKRLTRQCLEQKIATVANVFEEIRS